MKKITLILTLVLSSVMMFAQPQNDFCVDAISLTVYNGTCTTPTSGDLDAATSSLTAITCGGATSTTSDDVWYKFIATSSSHIISVDPSSGLDPVVDLRSGVCGSTTNITCSDLVGDGISEQITATGLTVGTTYFIRVYGFDIANATTTTFDICVTTAPPANDLCAGAILLTVYGSSCGATTTGDVTGATSSLPAIPCTATSPTSNDVWYKFVATATAHDITVVGSSSFDAVIDLRSGSCTGTNINCADANGNAGTEVINATGLTIGTTYLVRVYGYGTYTTNTFSICITTPGSTTAPANDNCSGATSLTVYGSSCGGATNGTVSGATQSIGPITCASPDPSTVSYDVWYKFIATATAHNITVVGSSGFDAIVDLRSGACNGTSINCADANFNGGTEVVIATGLTIGTTYYVRVYGWETPTTNTFTICVTTPAPAAPINDNCSGATSLTVYGATCGGTTTGNVSGATSSLPAVLCSNNTSSTSNDVWYKFLATATAHNITVIGSSDFDPVLDLRSGSCNGTNLNCADANGDAGTEVINATGLTIGNTYYVRVYGYGTYTTSTFSICITTPGASAPSNDLCANAVTLPVYGLNCGGTTAGDLTGATQSIAPITCGSSLSNVSKDVWYKFTATSTSHIITVNASSGLNAVIDLRSGSCTSGTNINCADANLAGGTETLTATGLTVGNTYYVRVYAFATPTTNSFSICVTTPTPPPANDNCSGATSLTVYGATCGQAVLGDINAATQSLPPISCNSQTSLFCQDVWYKFVATATTHNITVEGNLSFDPVVDLRSGSCTNGTNINCADATSFGGIEVINATGLTVGTTYYVRVYQYSLLPISLSTTFSICVTTPSTVTTPPANNDCSGAISVNVYGATCGAVTSGNISGATQSIAPLTCTNKTSASSFDVWYKFVATNSQHDITVVGSAGFDAVIDLRSGSCNGTNIACSDASTSGSEILNATGLTIGSTYYVRIYHFGSTLPTSTAFTLCITTPAPIVVPPVNDDCAAAILVPVYGPVCNSATSGDVSGATQSTTPIVCNGFTSPSSFDVWYKFVATGTKHDITVVGSTGFDAVVDLRSGSCNGTNISCSDASSSGSEVINATGLISGTAYYIRVYPYGSTLPTSTAFTLCVTTPDGGTTNIDNTELNGALSVFPNPASSIINVSIELASKLTQSLQLELTSLEGKVVYSNNINNFDGKYDGTINIEQEANGIYFLRVVTDKNTLVKKVIKE